MNGLQLSTNVKETTVPLFRPLHPAIVDEQNNVWNFIPHLQGITGFINMAEKRCIHCGTPCVENFYIKDLHTIPATYYPVADEPQPTIKLEVVHLKCIGMR